MVPRPRADTQGEHHVSIRDSRTGKTSSVAVIDERFMKSTDFGSLGLTLYDPGYFNTASCTSRITFIDGGRGILRYRGYGVEELAESSSYLEVSYLLLHGALPSVSQLKRFTRAVMGHMLTPHTEVLELIHGFRHDAHSMAVMVSALSALGAVSPDANPALHPSGQALYKDRHVREAQVLRLLGTFPMLAAHWLLRRHGLPPQPLPPLDPCKPLSYAEAFLAVTGLGKPNGLHDERPNPRVVRALDTLLIVHADHELNCSTAAVRHLTSSGVDVYTALAGGTGALYGPLHGGATEAVLRMLERIKSVDNIPSFLEAVKNRKERLMGFGHRVYRSYDPRARIVRKLAYEMFEIYGSDPLIDVATALEAAARADDYFVSRNLYPNIDFYSGLIYKAIGFPTDFFPVLFAMGRMTGWLAHWEEQCDDKENKIVRPQQNYKGPGARQYVPMNQRPDDGSVSAIEGQRVRSRL